MFTKLVTLTAAAAAVFASPISLQQRSSHAVIPHFNDWHGIKSLHNFDHFYGYDNYAGIVHKQVVLKSEKHLVCHKQQIEIVQQRLVVLKELMKKIITEQVCEVETQTIVFHQHYASLGDFRNDLHRKSHRQVGYDAHIAGLYHGLFNYDGSLSTHDLGFSGYDVGKHVIVASGNNWNPTYSPHSVQSAYDETVKAVKSYGDDIYSDINSAPESCSDCSSSEVTDAAEAPAPTEISTDGTDDASVTDAATPTDSSVSVADVSATASASDVSVAAASVTASADASASVSASAPAATSSNIDPATAP